MPKYVIERKIPGIGMRTPDELKSIAQVSCGVLQELGPKVQWVQSFVTDEIVYCLYIAPSEKLVREHAQRAGFPADRVSEVKSVIDPSTAE